MLAERFSKILQSDYWIDSVPELPISLNEYVAAKTLGVDVLNRIAVETVLRRGDSSVNAASELESGKSEFADEMLAWMGGNMSMTATLQSQHHEQCSHFLPILAVKTSRPEVAVRIFARFQSENEIRTIGRGRSVSHTISPDVRAAAETAIRIAEERLFQDLDSLEALPDCVTEKERDIAAKFFDKRNEQVIEIDNPDVIPHKGSGWNGDGRISEAEFGWYLQKQNWQTDPIPGAKHK